MALIFDLGGLPHTSTLHTGPLGACFGIAVCCQGDAKKAMIISEEAVEYFQRKKDKRGHCQSLTC